MSLRFAYCFSPCHSLPRKYGLDTKFPLASNQGRTISNKKYYYEFCKNIRASSSWTKNSENNNYVPSRLIIPSQNDIVIARSYSQGQQELDSSIPRHARFINLLRAIYQFSRPYAMYSTILSVILAAILPLTSLAQVNPAFLVGLLQAVAVNILVRAYVSGINDIYDVEIDKINKPYLPIPSGALPMKLAVAVLFMCLLGSVTLGIMFRSPPLIFGALFTCLFGTLYSAELPFMRWKRYPILVAVAVIMINAIGIPFSTFFHIQKYVMGSPTMFFTKSAVFGSCFLASVSTFLGIFKDIPDIIGDEKHGLQNMVTRFGVERVFWICITSLILMYGCAIGVGLTSSSLVTKLVTVPGHLALACILLYRALSTDPSVEGSAEDLYRFLWKLACAEGLMIPFIH